MAVVQTAVTGLALVAVAVATAVAVSVLLARRTDHLLGDVAPVSHRCWNGCRLSPARRTGSRTRRKNSAPRGRVSRFATPSGTPPGGNRRDLRAAARSVGCADRGPVRVCGARSASFAIVVAAPRAADEAARSYLLLALAA